METTHGVKMVIGKIRPRNVGCFKSCIVGKNPLRRKGPERSVTRETRELWESDKIDKVGPTLKTSGILEEFQAVSGFGCGPRNSIH